MAQALVESGTERARPPLPWRMRRVSAPGATPAYARSMAPVMRRPAPWPGRARSATRRPRHRSARRFPPGSPIRRTGPPPMRPSRPAGCPRRRRTRPRLGDTMNPASVRSTSSRLFGASVPPPRCAPPPRCRPPWRVLRPVGRSAPPVRGRSWQCASWCPGSRCVAAADAAAGRAPIALEVAVI